MRKKENHRTTQERIDKAQIYLEKLNILENNLNLVTNSVFDGQNRTEEVSKYIHNNCLTNDCIALLSEKDCREINQAISDIIKKDIPSKE